MDKNLFPKVIAPIVPIGLLAYFYLYNITRPVVEGEIVSVEVCDGYPVVRIATEDYQDVNLRFNKKSYVQLDYGSQGMEEYLYRNLVVGNQIRVKLRERDIVDRMKKEISGIEAKVYNMIGLGPTII
jgi:hypothetical protein